MNGFVQMVKGEQMRLIDADELRKTMYHEAFETDTDMQKWDSGCWIRYKMFENALENAPTIEAKSIIRCKNCEYYNGEDKYCVNDIFAKSNGYCMYGKEKDE